MEVDYKIPGYTIKKVLYKSTNNIVCVAINEKNKKEVVIKFNAGQLNLKSKSSYSIEKNLLDQLKKSEEHESLNIYGLEEVEGHMVLVMENGGESLHDFLKKSGPLSIEHFLKVAIRVVRFLGHIHHNKIIHKDIKPSNILVNEASDQFYIIDFNISTMLSSEKETISNAKLLEGSLPYISPEQTGRMNRGIDSRSDIYSLGITFYELLVGKLPFESYEVIDMIHYHMAKEFPFVSDVREDVPTVISKIIKKMISKGAEDRYQSAHALIKDFEKCQEIFQTDKKIPEFTLGEYDHFMELKIPDKPYGRYEDIEKLLAAFEVSSGGHIQLMVVKGPSGIGKTKLVNEVHKPIVAKTGLYMSGKFEQFKRDVPFSVFKHAFNELSKQLIAFGEERLNVIKDELRNELSDNSDVITDFAPQLKFLFDEREEENKTEQSAFELISRFKLNVIKFFRVISKKDHPIVMFIDDLQWADNASLELFDGLILSGEINNLLFIGAFRDNEMSEGHPFLKIIDNFKDEKVVGYSEIQVSPLGSESIAKMLEDMFLEKGKEKDISELSKLIFDKTMGNPFFINEFIKFIYSEKLIYFSEEKSGWNWDIEKIRGSEVSENVIDLMTRKLKKYDKQVQDTLNWASCLGADFNINDLAMVCDLSVFETIKSLQSPLTDGLLFTKGSDQQILSMLDLSEKDLDLKDELLDLSYKFVHDRVQESANKIISEEVTKERHFKIGERLRNGKDIDNLTADELFDIVNHLNLGNDFIKDDERILELSKLNFMAGHKAIEKLAFYPALSYIRIAQDLIKVDHFGTNFNDAIEYSLLRIETEYLNMNFDIAEKLALETIEKCQKKKQQLPFYIHLLTMSSYQGKNREATIYGLKAMEILGVKERITCGKIRFAFVYVWTLFKLRNIDFRDVPQFPDLKDDFVKQFINILSIMAPPAYLYNIELLIVLVFHALRFQARHGISSETAFLIAAFNAVDMSFRMKFSKCGMMIQIVEKILKRFPDNKMRGRVYLIFQYTFSRMKLNPEEARKLSMEAYNLSLNLGDNTYAATNLASGVYSDSVLGQDVKKLYKNAQFGHQASSKLKVYDMEWNNFMVIKLCKSLLGTNSTRSLDSLDDEDFVEERDVDIIFNKEHLGMRGIVLSIQAVRMLINKEYRNILKLYSKHPDWPFTYVGSVGFYFSVMAVTLAVGKYRDNLNFFVRLLIRPLIEFGVFILNISRKNNPSNHGATYYMVLGGKSLLLGNNEKASEYFYSAIDSSHENNYNLIAGLAYEYIGEILFLKKDFKEAQDCFKKSLKCYEKYNAKTKVKKMIKEYSMNILPHEVKWNFEVEDREMNSLNKGGGNDLKKNKNEKTIRGDQPLKGLTFNYGKAQVNFQTIFDSSKELSQEVVFEDLLEKIKDVLVKIVAPKKIVLGFINSENNEKMKYKVILGHNDYPELIINQSFEEQEDIIAESPFERGGDQKNNWVRDDYFRSNDPEMIVTFFLTSQQTKQGVLYLEAERSFKEVLGGQRDFFIPLVAQIAISLHNSKIYQSLEDRVKERTVELRNTEKKMIEMAHSSGMADISTKIFGRIEKIIPQVRNGGDELLKICEGKKALIDLKRIMENKKDELGNNGIGKLLINDDEEFQGLIKKISAEMNNNKTNFERNVLGFNQSIDIISEIVKENKNFTHKKSVNVDIELSEVVLEVKEKFPAIFDGQSNITIDFNFDEKEKVVVEKYKYFFALNAIIKNAVEALKEKAENVDEFKGKIEISILGKDENFETMIKDNGPGIEEGHLDEIFKSGFTTKKGSSGIGLHDSFNYIGSIGGKIKAIKEDSSDACGAILKIEFSKDNSGSKGDQAA